jgi:hypothetical protein
MDQHQIHCAAIVQNLRESRSFSGSGVAQIFNLLDRGSADCKSATGQIENLRYFGCSLLRRGLCILTS